jgi:Rod binding domain-containing protein
MDPSADSLSSIASASLATAPPVAAAGTDPAAARKVGEDFESFFLSQSFEGMFSGIGADSLFGGGEGESVFRSMLLQEYSKVAAKSGGVGIADAVQREILRMQEVK